MKSTIEEINNNYSYTIEKEFEDLYLSGFRSHDPIINEENEELKLLLANEILLKRKNLDTDNETTFIHDPILALLVNADNELIISDTLYKFTKEKGLFFSHVKDSLHFFDYLGDGSNRAKNDTSNLSSTYNPDESPCEIRALYGGVAKISDKISRYVTPIGDGIHDDCSGGGSWGTNPGITIPREDKIQDIINDLPVCGGVRHFIGQIFGKVYMCNTNYSKTRRVQVKFWDQNWLFYESVGILTKTQVRYAGIWFHLKVDEIHMGINNIHLKYKHSQPKITYHNPYASIPANVKTPIYVIDGKFQIQSNSLLDYKNIFLNVLNGYIPYFSFGTDDPLNIYIPLDSNIPDSDIDLNVHEIKSNIVIETIYKMGTRFLKKQMHSPEDPFVVTFQGKQDEIDVFYFDKRYHENNTNKVKKRFYQDGSFVFNYSYTNGNGSWNVTTSPVTSFRDYTYYDLDFFGMARRGDTWKGSRLIRSG